ncbi:MAG: hypothetical protein ACTHOF_12760 [Flavisolibacter sp.]
MKVLALLYFFYFFFFSTSFSQNTFQGHFITNNVMVKEIVLFQDSYSLSFSNYKSSFLTDQTTYTFNDYTPQVNYEDSLANWLVTRNMCYVDKFNLEIVNIDSSITASIPLKLLYKGNQLSLYYFYDVKDHFFVYDGNNMQELLVFYRYLTDWEKRQYTQNVPYYIVTPAYRNQILALMHGQLTNKQKKQIETTTYDVSSLIRLFAGLDKPSKKKVRKKD